MTVKIVENKRGDNRASGLFLSGIFVNCKFNTHIYELSNIKIYEVLAFIQCPLQLKIVKALTKNAKMRRSSFASHRDKYSDDRTNQCIVQSYTVVGK